MKISYILESFGGGGKERRCLQLIQGLNAQGYNEIQVIIINGIVEYPELFNTSAKIIILDRCNRKLSWLQTYREVKDIIIEFKPDIVQAWGVLSMGICSIVRIFHKFKFICANVADCNKMSWYRPQTFISHFSYFFADAVVGNSMAGLRAYNVPKNKAYCIYNGFNESRYDLVADIDKQKLLDELQINTKYLVAMFARIDQFKDTNAFIELARNTLKDRDDVTFISVGKGIYYDKYKEETSNEDKIRFIGFRSDVEQLMSITDVTILFSNFKLHKEGVSNSIMESMALGTPVIATDDGGSPEIVNHGVNGFLVKENDVKLASKYLSSLLDDKSKIQLFSKNAEDTIRSGFLLRTMVSNYLSLYQNLMKSN